MANMSYKGAKQASAIACSDRRCAPQGGLLHVLWFLSWYALHSHSERTVHSYIEKHFVNIRNTQEFYVVLTPRKR